MLYCRSTSLSCVYLNLALFSNRIVNLSSLDLALSGPCCEPMFKSGPHLPYRDRKYSLISGIYNFRTESLVVEIPLERTTSRSVERSVDDKSKITLTMATTRLTRRANLVKSSHVKRYTSKRRTRRQHSPSGQSALRESREASCSRSKVEEPLWYKHPARQCSSKRPIRPICRNDPQCVAARLLRDDPRLLGLSSSRRLVPRAQKPQLVETENEAFPSESVVDSIRPGAECVM